MAKTAHTQCYKSMLLWLEDLSSILFLSLETWVGNTWALKKAPSACKGSV